MKGLLLKDLIVITKQLKLFLIAIPILALAGGRTSSAFAVLLGAVIPMTAIAYDERSKWTELAVMMPYSKAGLVLSKYFLGYICMTGSVILVVLGQLLKHIYDKSASSDNTLILIVSIFAGLIFIAINTPILFKFGSEKGRFVFIIAMMLLGASGPLLSSINSDILSQLINVSPLLLIVIAIVLNFVSIFISKRIRLKV